MQRWGDEAKGCTEGVVVLVYFAELLLKLWEGMVVAEVLCCCWSVVEGIPREVDEVGEWVEGVWWYW